MVFHQNFQDFLELLSTCGSIHETEQTMGATNSQWFFRLLRLDENKAQICFVQPIIVIQSDLALRITKP